MYNHKYWIISYKNKFFLKNRKAWKRAKNEPDTFKVVYSCNHYKQALKVLRSARLYHSRGIDVSYGDSIWGKLPPIEYHCDRNNEYVYGLYSGDGKLIYIGVTNNPEMRASQHLKSRKFAKMEVLFDFTSRSEAEAFEIFAIFNINPPSNSLILEPSDSYTFNLKDLELFGKISNRRPKRKISSVLRTEEKGLL